MACRESLPLPTAYDDINLSEAFVLQIQLTQHGLSCAHGISNRQIEILSIPNHSLITSSPFSLSVFANAILGAVSHDRIRAPEDPAFSLRKDHFSDPIAGV